MGIARRIRHNPEKENLQFNRESRPWDNQASLPPHPKFIPIRPPAPRSPAQERFTPLLRPPDFKKSPSKAAGTSVSPRRKADHFSTASSPFAPVDTSAFQGQHSETADNMHTPERAPKGLSVSDRLRIFENLDQSVRERTPPHVLRKSPFKSALEAFGGRMPEQEAPSSSSSSSTSEEAVRRPSELGLKTRIGNREVKPLVAPPKPPLFVGLPIPQNSKKRLSQRVDTSIFEMKESETRKTPVAMQRAPVRVEENSKENSSAAENSQAQKEDSYETSAKSGTASGSSSGPSSDLTTTVDSSQELSEGAPVDVPTLPSIPKLDDDPATEEQKMTLNDPELMPRFSYRSSVRLDKSSISDGASSKSKTTRSSFRHSGRLDSESVSNNSFLPRSSSFLHFDDEVDRMVPLGSESRTGEESEPTSKAPSAWTEGSFDEPDSFDTFATVPKSLQPALELKSFVSAQEKNAAPRPGTDDSEKPLSPNMSFHKGSMRRVPVEEEDDGTLDVPNRFTRRPGAEGALRDLQRASVTAGNEIAASLRLMSEGDKMQDEGVTKKEKVSRVQGDLLLRSRIFRRWNLRYASIVQQGYFGAVLLLFRSDVRGGPGGPIALKSSKMIALTDSSVRKVDGGRRAVSTYMFELKTSQRTYMFACNDEQGREFWMQNLSSGSRDRPRG